MRTFGIVLLVLGIALLSGSGFSFMTRQQRPDAAPQGANPDAQPVRYWPVWIGGAMTVAGLVLSFRKR